MPLTASDILLTAALKGSGGGGGTTDHAQLTNRDIADQHPISAITDLESNLSNINSSIDEISNRVGYVDKVNKIRDYVWEATYSHTDEEWAIDWLENHEINHEAQCSAIFNPTTRTFYRNYDWKYNKQISFITHIAAQNKSHAVDGCSTLMFLKETSTPYLKDYDNEYYRILPFLLLDGKNDAGLMACANVVPTDNGENVTVPQVEQQVRLNGLMVVRYVLDHFTGAHEAAEWLRDYASIWFHDDFEAMGYECHYMIADATGDYVIVELQNNEVVILDEDTDVAPCMTNFILNNVVFNEDGTVYTPGTQDATHNASLTNHITDHGAGLERYNMLIKNFTGDEDDLSIVKYSNAYTLPEDENYWYTEFVGDYPMLPEPIELTVSSTPEQYAPIVEYVKNLWDERSRDTGDCWHTVHSCVYTPEMMRVYAQEDFSEPTYILDKDKWILIKALEQVNTNVQEINEKIPEDASDTNQLATKADVASTGAFMFEFTFQEQEGEFVITSTNATPEQLLEKYLAGISIKMMVDGIYDIMILDGDPNEMKIDAHVDMFNEGGKYVMHVIMQAENGTFVGTTINMYEETYPNSIVIEDTYVPQDWVETETWTFTLEDDTTVTKKVMLWNQPQ